MEKIAIDVGSGVTKAICASSVATLPSVVGPYRDGQFSLNGDRSYIVEFCGKKFAVGAPAAACVAPEDRADTLCDEWYQSDGYLALVYKALAQIAPSQTTRIAVCTGLPIAIWEAERETLADRLTGTHKFSVGDRKYEIILRRPNVHIMPQAIGLYFETLDSVPELTDGPCGFIDIGTFTTGYAVVEGSTVRNWMSDGCRIGMHQIIEELRETYGRAMDGASVVESLRRGELLHRGSVVDIRPVLDPIVERTAEALVEEVREKWGEGQDLHIFVGGGGADIFFGPIRKFYRHARKVSESDPHLAVVSGYAKYVAAKYKAVDQKMASAGG